MSKFWLRQVYRNEEGGDDGSAGSGAVGTGNDARVALLNQIGDGVDVEREDQLANVNNDDTTEPFQAEKPPTPEPEVVDPQDPPAGEKDPSPTTVKLKVNGEELELSLEEVIARAQKVESADRYLAEAASKLREAEQPPQRQEQVVEDPKPEEIDYGALARALQIGSEEEAVAALKRLHKPERPSRQDDVSRVIDERLMFRDAYGAFRKEFEDVVSDPKLNAMALQMDQEQIAKGDTRPYAERYTEIGNEIRNWVSGFKTPEPSATATREQRKAELPKTPEAASGKAKPAQQEQEEDDSPSAVVAKMAAARGGPQWMRDLPKQ